MAEANKPYKTAPIIDVAQPGKSAPSATSRSIIVNHRPRVQDPMVTAEKPKPDVDKDVEVVPDPAVPKIEDQTQLRPAAEQTIQPPAAATDDKIEAVDEAKPEPAKAESENPDPTEGDESTTAEAKDPAVDAQVEAAKQAEHDAAIQKLADRKQYFLPIDSVEQRRSQRFVVLGIVLSLVLAVAWVDIALDAGLIKISGIKPVTHFFSN